MNATEHVSHLAAGAESGHAVFSEIRDAARERTIAVAASATVGAALSLTAAVLLALGVVR